MKRVQQQLKWNCYLSLKNTENELISAFVCGKINPIFKTMLRFVLFRPKLRKENKKYGDKQ